MGPDRLVDGAREVACPGHHPVLHDRPRCGQITTGSRHRVSYRATERGTEIQLGRKDLCLHLQASQGSLDRTIAEHDQFMTSVPQGRRGGHQRLQVTAGAGGCDHEDSAHHDER